MSLEQDLRQVTQADVIVKVLNESKMALTKQEIAERLKSKSIGHASFYLENLISEGRVVRIDSVVYSTPEKAFVDLDVEGVMGIIKQIMNSSTIIVEADIFREYVNMELNLSYSKYFYAALVRTKMNEFGLPWQRHGNLFSKDEIPYKSLIDMCKRLCRLELSNEQNMRIIQNTAWLTDAVATSNINNWRAVSVRSRSM